MAKRIVIEEIQLNQKTPGVTLSDGTANVDSEVIRFSVPDSSQVEIRPSDFLGLYLATSVPAEIEATAQITILRVDAVNRRTKVLAQGEYAQFKEMTDALKKYFFKGKIEVVPAKFLLIIKALSESAIASAQTRFTQSCKFVYETIE